MGELDFSTVEKVVKILLKIKVAGIVSGSGFSENGKCFQGASDLHSLSGGKKSVIACSTTKKSREVVSLFTVADRIFIRIISVKSIIFKFNNRNWEKFF